MAVFSGACTLVNGREMQCSSFWPWKSKIAFHESDVVPPKSGGVGHI